MRFSIQGRKVQSNGWITSNKASLGIPWQSLTLDGSASAYWDLTSSDHHACPACLALGHPRREGLSCPTMSWQMWLPMSYRTCQCINMYIIYIYHCTPISKPIQLLQPSNNGTRSRATCQLMCVHVESTRCRVESQGGTHHKDKDSNSCFSTAPEPKQWRLESRGSAVLPTCPLEKFLSPTLPTVLTEQNLHSIATSY